MELRNWARSETVSPRYSVTSSASASDSFPADFLDHRDLFGTGFNHSSAPPSSVLVVVSGRLWLDDLTIDGPEPPTKTTPGRSHTARTPLGSSGVHLVRRVTNHLFQRTDPSTLGVRTHRMSAASEISVVSEPGYGSRSGSTKAGRAPETEVCVPSPDHRRSVRTPGPCGVTLRCDLDPTRTPGLIVDESVTFLM